MEVLPVRNLPVMAEESCRQGAVSTARDEGTGGPFPARGHGQLQTEHPGSSRVMLGETSPLPRPLLGDFTC